MSFYSEMILENSKMSDIILNWHHEQELGSIYEHVRTHLGITKIDACMAVRLSTDTIRRIERGNSITHKRLVLQAYRGYLMGRITEADQGCVQGLEAWLNEHLLTYRMMLKTIKSLYEATYRSTHCVQVFMSHCPYADLANLCEEFLLAFALE